MRRTSPVLGMDNISQTEIQFETQNTNYLLHISGKKEPITSHNSTYQTGDSGESMFQSIIKSSPLMDDVG